jgi:hypothetical protein
MASRRFPILYLRVLADFTICLSPSKTPLDGPGRLFVYTFVMCEFVQHSVFQLRDLDDMSA